MSEQSFIRNAAPTLAGLKTGSLFPFRYESRAGALRELRSLNRRLAPKGLRLLPLRMSDGFAVLYLYRPAMLREDLQDPAAACLLKEAGYKDCSESACLRELYRRFNREEGFPHEIGLFLSYPPEDVRGFIENKGRRCKCAGCWKVYGDAEQARRRFEEYHSCTARYCRQYAMGVSMDDLSVTVS